VSAYFGTGGADLLPLKKGDRLVVDMSMGAVRQGVTNPREIERLMQRGVQVFTRASLHAKFFLIDEVLIVGSSNVSQSSQAVLDEAALSTTSQRAMQSARQFFDQLCSEPVRDKYLQECLKAYKPPKFKAARMPRSQPRRKGTTAKLWFIAGIRFLKKTPRDDEEKIEALEEQAREKMVGPAKGELTWTRYLYKPKFFSAIRRYSWVVECIADDAGRKRVYAPKQVIDKRSYTSARGKKCLMLFSEGPPNDGAMGLKRFRAQVKTICPELDRQRMITRPVENTETADKIMRLWTATGKVRMKRKV
jgi:hypothetical protein